MTEKSGAGELGEPYERLELKAPVETVEQEFCLQPEFQPRMNATERV